MVSVYVVSTLEVKILQVSHNFSLMSMDVVSCHKSLSEAMRRTLVLRSAYVMALLLLLLWDELATRLSVCWKTEADGAI
jgi:hypothetical protein